jgi:hypothetical protein
MLCEPGPRSSYFCSKCIIHVIPLHNQLISLINREGLYRERNGGGMLRPNIIKGCKSWDERGRDFGRVYLF